MRFARPAKWFYFPENAKQTSSPQIIIKPAHLSLQSGLHLVFVPFAYSATPFAIA